MKKFQVERFTYGRKTRYANVRIYEYQTVAYEKHAFHYKQLKTKLMKQITCSLTVTPEAMYEERIKAIYSDTMPSDCYRVQSFRYKTRKDAIRFDPTRLAPV